MRRLFLIVVLAIIGCDNQQSDSAQAPPVQQAASADQSGADLQTATLAPGYVGSASCQQCHSEAVADWQGSHHDLAMQHADQDTVLGDFNDAAFDYFGVTSHFFKKAGAFYVRTDGPDGKLTAYKIAYTFGVYPLQQYLVEFSGGRLQALNIVWDSRSKAQGGQRWYHLYPDEPIRHGDELHWTGINQNWNFMCADCHSTNLRKNYDAVSQTYHTTWSDIDVNCEACHGPASGHLAWAANPDSSVNYSGFSLAFSERRGASWHIDPATGNATRQPAKHSQTEIDNCARCHARRATMFPDATGGDALLQHFRPSLLEAGLYHADGQIDGEVYVYGSFLQSKMYRAGVTCSDCHNPHSLRLRAEGNNLCGQCHLATQYDTPDHHFHEAGSEGAQCVNCHMPAKVYMGVDARRDHSFRIPRPDLSQQLGTPNACNTCHTDQSATWAAGELLKRHRVPRGSEWATVLHKGRRGQPGAGEALLALAADTRYPDIVRATAVSLLPQYFSQPVAMALQGFAQGDEPLLGLALAGVLQQLPEQYRPVFAVPLLYEPWPTLRALAAGSLSGLPLDQFPAGVKAQYRSALAEYVQSETYNADRPEALVNLARYAMDSGDEAKAVAWYRQAIGIAPYYVPAWVNFADFYYQLGDEQQGRVVLQEALVAVREKAAIHHALGLSLVRSGDNQAALDHLRIAAQSPHTTARFRYVYGVALSSMGHPQEAIAVLVSALQDYPGNRDIVAALAALYRDAGDDEKAAYYQSML